MVYSRRNSGEVVTTALLIGALVAIVGSILGAGSQILKSSAYAPVPRIERTVEKTTLEVHPDATKENVIHITGNLCFGAGLGSGIEKTTLWASDDPPGKNVISNVLAQTFNGGSGDYPAPCIKPDFEGDAILTNANATPSRFFSLNATLSEPLTDKCVDVYLHLYSNRQGRWPNFRRFKVNKNGLCINAPTATGQPSGQPSPVASVTPVASITPPVSGFPTRFPSDRPTVEPTRPVITPTGKPGSCGQSCSLTNKCESGLTCITDLCVPSRPGCVVRSFCVDLGDPANSKCKPIVTPTVTPPIPCSNPNRPTCSVPTRTPSASPTPISCVQNAPGWLDNNRSKFIASAWAKQHRYSDCPSDSSGTWPTSGFDCLIPDQGSGPSTADQALVKDPASLYYKHLTPVDLFSIITLDSIRTLQQVADENLKKIIRDAIVNAVKKNPERFSNISFDSVSAGLEGGRDGNVIRSLSMWVHPVIETIITDAISVEERARLLYQPYIEGAIGEKVSTDDVVELYNAALNHCGSSAQGGVQSGLGVKKVFGEYTAVVQNWAPGGSSEDDIFSDFKDCNIHVVRTTQCIPTPTPPGPTGSDKPNISGKITLRSCLSPEFMRVSRCEKGGTRSDCKDLIQDDMDATSPKDDSIWLDENESDPDNDLYVFNYRIVTDSQNKEIEEGAEYQVPDSSMKVDLTAYYSRHNSQTVTATGTRDFTITVPPDACGPTPTVEPTSAPRCIFNPISYVKIRENGEDRLFTEVANDATKWGTMNDRRIAKLGTSTNFRTPFDDDGRHMPCGEAGCDLTGKRWCCVDDNDTPGDSYDLRKDPDYANVTLFYPKDKFKIVAKCNDKGECEDVDEGDILGNRIDKLPIGCNREYTYGWVVERKPAASCKLTDSCEPTIKSVVRDPDSGETPASSVKIEWDKPAVGCEFDGYTMEVVEPTDNGIVVCRATVENPSPNKKSTSCHLKYDEPLDKTGAITKHTWIRGVEYTINLYATSTKAPDCRSKPGSWVFSRDSDKGGTEPEPAKKEYNTFALNLFDADEFKPGGANNLCWAVGNNDDVDNVRGPEQNGFSCNGKVNRDDGKVTSIELCYQNKKGSNARMSWQISRCEESSDNCQQDNTGPDGDRVEEAADLQDLEDGKWNRAVWDTSTLKPTKVEWETNLDSCGGSSSIKQQVIPPFAPSRRIAPQGVGPIGFAAGYPDYQRTDDGKIILNAILINDITQDPISTDSEGNLVIAQEPDYRISFLPKHDSQFLIDILGSPFDEVREKAEDHFVQLLGIDKPDACWLYVVESTTDTANPEEAKKNHMLSFCEYRLRADINGDKVINAIDYALLAQKYAQSGYTGREDINEDGTVDSLDVSILVDNFGRRVE